MISRKLGPTPDTEYVDEKSVALPSIIQIGDVEFTILHKPASALAEGTHLDHIMFATPNDDNHFVFTVERYTAPDADFFRKLAETRLTAKTPKKKDYDHRTYAPFRENVRQEDIVTQGTQGSIDQREEHLAVSDRAIILLRKSILNAIKVVQKGGASSRRCYQRRCRRARQDRFVYGYPTKGNFLGPNKASPAG